MLKVSGIKHKGRAADTATVAAVAVIGEAGDRGVRGTKPCLLGPSLPVPLGNAALDLCVDDAIFETKKFLNLYEILFRV